jgi:hypothetical protein
VIGHGVNGGWGLVGFGFDAIPQHLRRANGGVYGEGALGDGVYGYSRDGHGVLGASENNDGARGESDQGVGVFGQSSSFTYAAVQGTSRPPAGGPPEGIKPEDVHPTGVFGIAGAYDPDNNYIVDNGIGVRGTTLSAEADPRSPGAHGVLGEAPNAATESPDTPMLAAASTVYRTQMMACEVNPTRALGSSARRTQTPTPGFRAKEPGPKVSSG